MTRIFTDIAAPSERAFDWIQENFFVLLLAVLGVAALTALLILIQVNKKKRKHRKRPGGKKR